MRRGHDEIDRMSAADRWSMTALALALFATVSATAMPNAALPILSRELHVGDAASVWIIALFQIGSAVTLLPAAALVDIRGVRPVLLGGLAIFTAASLACMACTTLTGLAIARTIQGIGSAGAMTVTGALVRQCYPAAHRGRGLGLAAFMTATAGAVAPTLGSLLVVHARWQMIFAVSTANGAVALAIACAALRKVARADHGFPLRQAAMTGLVTAATLIGLFGVAQGGRASIYLPVMMAGLVGAVPLIRQQKALLRPLVPVDLLALPELARAYGLSVLFFCAHLVTFVALPFLLIFRLALPAAEVGLMMAPMSLFAAIGAPIAGRLAERVAADSLALTGIGVLALGIACLALAPIHAGWLDLGWRTALTGLGIGLFQTPNFKLIIGAASPARAGSAGGLQAMTRLVGQALGSTIAALCLHLAGSASLAALVAAGSIAAGATIAGAVAHIRQGRRTPTARDA